MLYRVKWTKVEIHTGYVNDGDQDADDWSGSLIDAKVLAKTLGTQYPKLKFVVEPVPKNKD